MVRRGDAADGAGAGPGGGSGGEPWGTGTHPLLAAAGQVRAALSSAHDAMDAGTCPSWLDAPAQATLLEDLGRARAQLDALLIRTLAATDRAQTQPDGVVARDGARSSVDWLAHRLHTRPSRLAAHVHLAPHLARHPHLAAALAAGRITLDHARAALEVLDDLPATDLEAITPGVMDRAEQTLLDHCETFTPPQVRRLGRHLLEVLAPDQADQLEARRLADQERHARRRTTLRLRRTAHGTRLITGEIPELHASILDTALHALTNPRRPHHERPQSPESPGSPGEASPTPTTPDDGQRISATQRRGQAFCTLLEHLPTETLPTHGRGPITITVTIDEARLRDQVTDPETGIGLLSTGVDLSPGELRRLACDHGILPAVLGGDSHVLDLGRQTRYYNRHQRTALTLTHPECQTQGCTIPAAWCDAHHRRPWSTGGPTDLRDGALLCPHHHHTAHDPHYQARWSPDDTVTFHRRP